MKVAMFCIILTAEPSVWDMDAKIVSMHDAMSACHMALTEHGFEKPNDKCFCVVADANESQ
tara:strand:+ start:3091 stop:3273 length:183 start_codon:yes stop_codon:yes gene_type:complete